MRNKHIFTILSLACTFHLLVSHEVLVKGETLCSRESSDKDGGPDFLCIFNATIYRRPNCSVFIIEDIVYPLVGADNPYRTISISAKTKQEVVRPSLRVNGEPAAIITELTGGKKLKVIMVTPASSSPVWFQLSYFLRNGIMKFTKDCGTGEPDPSKNVIKWSTGELSESVDLMNVKFVSGDANVTLKIIDGGPDNKNVVERVFKDVSEPLEVYAVEYGTTPCEQSLSCSEGNRAVIIWVSVMAALVASVIIVFLCILFCCRNR